MSEPPNLESATVIACCLEVPIEDFEHLPAELGCSLHRAERELTMVMSDAPGCAMHFKLEGKHASLDRLVVSNDPQGRFFRDVVCLLLQVYSGDLEAELSWSTPGAKREQVRVRGGETTHPLLVPAERPENLPDDSLARAEQWLAEAQRAWGDYERLKVTAAPPV